MTDERKIEILEEMRGIDNPWLCYRISDCKGLGLNDSYTIEGNTFYRWFVKQKPSRNTDFTSHKYWKG